MRLVDTASARLGVAMSAKDRKRFSCKICGVTIKSQRSFARHMKGHDPVVRARREEARRREAAVLQERQAAEWAVRRQEIEARVRQVSAERGFLCATCGRETSIDVQPGSHWCAWCGGEVRAVAPSDSDGIASQAGEADRVPDRAGVDVADADAAEGPAADADAAWIRLYAEHGCYCGSLWMSADAMLRSGPAPELTGLFDIALYHVMALGAKASPGPKGAVRVADKLLAAPSWSEELQRDAEWLVERTAVAAVAQRCDSLASREDGGLLSSEQLASACSLAAALSEAERCEESSEHVSWGWKVPDVDARRVEASVERSMQWLTAGLSARSHDELAAVCEDVARRGAAEDPALAASLREIASEGRGLELDDFRDVLFKGLLGIAVDCRLMIIHLRAAQVPADGFGRPTPGPAAASARSDASGRQGRLALAALGALGLLWSVGRLVWLLAHADGLAEGGLETRWPWEIVLAIVSLLILVGALGRWTGSHRVRQGAEGRR